MSAQGANTLDYTYSTPTIMTIAQGTILVQVSLDAYLVPLNHGEKGGLRRLHQQVLSPLLTHPKASWQELPLNLLPGEVKVHV